MDKKELKKELLKMLKSDMLGMKSEGKKGLFEEMMPKKADMQKVTVMSDSPEGLVKGLTKAEQIMKAKLGEKSYESDEDETEEYEEKKMCPMCKNKPCKCD